MDNNNILYTIVDGHYLRKAKTMLMKIDKIWDYFQTLITDIKCGQSMGRYLQFTRMQNVSHSPHFHVRYTLPDNLCNFPFASVHWNRKEVSLTAAMVVEHYCGSRGYINASINQTAQIATRHPSFVITIVRNIAKYQESRHAPSSRLSKQNWRKIKRRREYLRLATVHSAIFCTHHSENHPKMSWRKLLRNERLHISIPLISADISFKKTNFYFLSILWSLIYHKFICLRQRC